MLHIVSVEQVEIDGIVAGNLIDVVCNHPSIRAEALVDLNRFIQSKQDQLHAHIQSLQRQIDLANSRIEQLSQELPFNPREIHVQAFKARLFAVLRAEDIVRLYASNTDLVLESIAQTITEWDDAAPIRLDSQALIEPLSYLQSIGLLSDEEVERLRRDCSREEAFRL